MDIAQLEKLAELRDKGALTQEEFENEKQKLLNSKTDMLDVDNEETTSNDNEIQESIEEKASDFWHDHGMKIVMIIIIVIGVGYMQANEEEMNLISYIILFGIAAFVGAMLKEYQKMSKDIKDINRYKNIDEVINKFGTPDDIHQYGEYTKYTFKKSTNGWGWFKYQTDVFTTQKDKIIKHENYYE